MVKYTWIDPMGFQVLTMSFSHGGHQVFFKGLQPLWSHYQGSDEFFKAPVWKG